MSFFLRQRRVRYLQFSQQKSTIRDVKKKGRSDEEQTRLRARRKCSPTNAGVCKVTDLLTVTAEDVETQSKILLDHHFRSISIYINGGHALSTFDSNH